MTLDQLQRFDQYPHRETFARITHWDISIPSNKYQIEGRITGGSANLDGNSAVRRSCSLTLACPSDFIADDIWLNYNTSLTNRFRLEVGLTNFNLLNENFEAINILKNGTIDNTILDLRELKTDLEGTTLILSDVDGDLDGHPNITYDQDRQIFWFDLGEYICSSYSVSQSTNSLTINISGKDKMCLLNGEIGGKIESTVDFGTFDQVAEDNTITNTKIPVDEIIKEAVHHYGQIPYEDIEIADIPNYGTILKEYRYDTPLYLFRKPEEINGKEQFKYIFGTLNKEQKVQTTTNIQAFFSGDGKSYANPDNSSESWEELEEPTIFPKGTGYKTNEWVYLNSQQNLLSNNNPKVILTNNYLNLGSVNRAGYVDSCVIKIKVPSLNFNLSGYNMRTDLDQQKLSIYILPINQEDHIINIDTTNDKDILWTQIIEPYGRKLGTFIWNNDERILVEIESEEKEVLKSSLLEQVVINPSEINEQKEIIVAFVGAGLSSTIQLAGLEFNNCQALKDLSNIYFDKTIPMFESAVNSVFLDGIEYKLHRIDFGETAGYEQTPLVYPGELIAKPGETITASVLDKIKNMLGDYEYFFKTNGKFRFQKRATAYAYQDMPSEAEEELYTFPEGKTMFTAFSTTPQISNVRNDFSIWGSRKGAGGADIAIHGRFAIQEKPKSYEAFEIEDEEKENFKTKYGVELTSQGGCTVDDTNSGGWREVLYQMAKDYYAYSRIPRYVNENEDVIAKYQPYFSDMLGFWRQIYCPVNNENEKVFGIEYDSEGWNVNVNQAPHLLNFCIEFFGLDYPEYSKYSIDKIGYRPDVSNDSSVGAIQYSAIPQIIFYDGDSPPANEENVALFKVPGLMKDMFSTSTQKRSVYDAAATLKLNKIECLENVSITSIPVFHLEPNTRVKIEGDKYLITRLTMPLTYNGTMSITASKIIETKPIEELIGASTGGK